MIPRRRKKTGNNLERFRLQILSPRILYSADVSGLIGITGATGMAYAVDADEQVAVLGDADARALPYVQHVGSNHLISQQFDAQNDAQYSQSTASPVVIATDQDAGDEALSAAQWFEAVAEALETNGETAELYLPVNEAGLLSLSDQSSLSVLDLLGHAREIASWQEYLSPDAQIFLYHSTADESGPASRSITEIPGDAATVQTIQTLSGSQVETALKLFADPVNAQANNLLSSSFTPPGFDNTVHVVTNLNDSGAGSLREAMSLASSNNLGTTLIRFDVSGTISLNSELPVVSTSVYIDAFDGVVDPSEPRITLDGSSVGGSANGLIFLGSTDSFVQGIKIINFSANGISANNADGLIIQGNYIGTDGNNEAGNGRAGVSLLNSNNVVVANNVISANSTHGISVSDGDTLDLDNITIVGNTIGLSADGMTVLGNNGVGINLSNIDGIQIGLDQDSGNIISGNGDGGIYGSKVNDIVVGGNVIGLLADGETAAENLDAGIFFTGTSNTVTIGYSSAIGSAGNVISGSVGSGIVVSAGGDTIQNVSIAGNHIGVSSDGETAIGNGLYGIELAGRVIDLVIGGTDAQSGNVISGNDASGIYFSGDRFNTVTILNNTIGLSASGSTVLANQGQGINIDSFGSHSANLVIGGALGTGNHIAGNVSGEIRLSGVVGTEILGNRFGITSDGDEVQTAGRGIYLVNSNDTIVGAENSGNIFGTYESGLYIEGNSQGAQISHNVFGFINGQQPAINLNEFGINVQSGADDTHIELNEFYFTTVAAINYAGTDLKPSIVRNTYFGNTGELIRYLGIGATHPARPVIESATLIDADSAELSVSFDENSNTDYLVEYYIVETDINSPTELIGSVVVTTDSTGQATDTSVFNSGNLRPGQVIATITTSVGQQLFQTSEFSAATALEGGAVTSNDQPQYTGATEFNVLEGAIEVGVLQAFDPEGDPLNYQIVENIQDGHLFEVVNGNELQFLSSAPVVDNTTPNGQHEFTVQVAVDDGHTAVFQTLTVFVNNDNQFGAVIAGDSDSSDNTISVLDPVGTTVGITVDASDPDLGDQVAYTIEQSPGFETQAYFTIDTSSGVITIGNALDQAAVGVHTVTVTATSSDGSQDVKTFDIMVESGRVDATAALSVTENSPNGTLVGNISHSGSTTPDNPQWSIVSGNDDLIFTIDAATGDITVDDPTLLNAEAQTEHNLGVLVTDSGVEISHTDVAITVTDVNEFSVVGPSDIDTSINTVAESAPLNTPVGITVEADDLDLTDVASLLLTDNAFELFNLDPNTGIVSTASNLSSVAGTDQQITIQATSTDGSVSEQVFTIHVMAETLAVSDGDSSLDAVDENAPIESGVGIQVQVTNANSIDTLTYSLSESAGGRFSIDSSSGVVTTTDLFDAEVDGAQLITVLVTSSNGTSSTIDFSVVINDVNEHAASIPVDTVSGVNSVDETAALNTFTGISATADDFDISDNVTLNLAEDRSGFFFLTNTGQLVVNADLSGQAGTNHTVVIQAVSSDGSTASREFQVSITGDVSPLTDVDAAQNSVEENSPINSAVGITVEANDPDSINTVTYSLTGNDNGPFAIDPVTGVVSTTQVLDAEANDFYTIQVTALSSDGSASSGFYVISVSDVNEHAPVVGDQTLNIDENTATGTTLTTLTASDGDVTGSVDQWAIVSGNNEGLFILDPVTGVLEVASGAVLDAETDGLHTVVVTAFDGDFASEPATVTINVNDVNGFTVSQPTDIDAASSVLSFDTALNSPVGIQAFATDADVTDSVHYSLTGDALGRFEIDQNSGEIFTAQSLVNDAGTTFTLTVTAISTDGSEATQDFEVVVTGPLASIEDDDLGGNVFLEESAVGTSVGITVQAFDPDANDTVSYSLTNDPIDAFQIDPVTGVVTTNQVLSAETQEQLSFTAVATSSDGSSLSKDFVVTLIDINEFAPQLSAQTENVTENAPNGTVLVNELIATDADLDATPVQYSIVGGNESGIFGIDATSGAIEVVDNTLLDAEADTVHTLTVVASDGTLDSAPTDITLNVLDVNEAPVLTDADVSTESVFIGSIGQLEFVDPDSGDTHSFSIDGVAVPGLEINNQGVITQNGNVDAGVYELPVVVTDQDGLSTTAVLRVTVAESAPLIEEEPAPEPTPEPAPEPAPEPTPELAVQPPAAALPVEPVEQPEVIGPKDELINVQVQLEVVETTVSMSTTGNTMNVSVAEPSAAQETSMVLTETISSGSSTASADADGDLGGTDEALVADTIDFSGGEDLFNVVAGTSESRLRADRLASNALEAIALQLIGGSNDSQSGLVQADLGNGRALALDLLVKQGEDTVSDFKSLGSLFISENISSSFSPELINALHTVSEDLAENAAEEDAKLEFKVSSITFVSGAVTIGFVTWLLQSGSLVATAITSAPLWQGLDPVPVLSGSDSDEDN